MKPQNLLLAIIFILNITPYGAARILDKEQQQWMKMGHLLLPSLKTVNPPSPNGCTWVRGSGGRPCRSSISEKNFAGLLLPSLKTVNPPSPNGCTWVGGSGGRPCRSSINEKNFAGRSVAAAPPPLRADDDAYPEQMVQFGKATNRK